MKLLIAPWLCILCAAVDEPATRFLQSRAVKTQTKGTPADADRHDGLVTTATGGAQLWLSKVALNYVAQELLPQILRNLTRVPLGSYKGTYKGVEYRLWDVDLNHMGINKPSIQFRKDEGLHFCLSGIHANVTSDWSAEWYFVSLEGATSVLVADGEVCAVIALKAAHGRPKVEIDNLDVTLELGPITFTGTSIHWLMNAAAFLFESYLEDLASSTIKSNVETAVKKNLAESLKHLDLSTSLEMPENKGSISIDVSLESIKTQANYLQVDVKGLPSVNDTACPFPPQEESYRVPNAWSTHMASGSVSHWGVDCAIWAVNQTGLFRYYLWPSYIPKNALGIKLDTDFMSVLVPGLKTHYDRNWDLVVTISPFALPTITFESGYVYLVGPINFSFNRCKPKNRKRTRWTKREFVFNFIADVHANGHMWIEHNPSRLETNVSLLGASNVRQGDSMAGPVDLHYASQLLQVLRGPGEDALNDVTLKNGIPLSSNSSFSLDNVELNISKGGAFFFSDIAVRFGNELQQLLNRQLSRS